MLKFPQRMTVALLLLGIAWRLEAAEVTVTRNWLAYPAKEYSSAPPAIEYGGDVSLRDRSMVARQTCVDTRTRCVFALSDVHYRDHLTGFASMMIARSESGWGWYGTMGAWHWETLRPKSDAQASCLSGKNCLLVSEDFEVRRRAVVYAGVGLQYRFDWRRFSVTPSFGVVGHWPRIDSVTGSSHLFQTSVRIGVKLTERSTAIVQYAHLSNGKGLGLADKGSPNQGIEQFGLGLSYRF